MDFRDLREKYQAVLTENKNLKEEIKSLKDQLGIVESQDISDGIFVLKSEPEIFEQELTVQALSSGINNKSDSMEKIKFFMSLFRGRDDVYAKRWANYKKGTDGYSPACYNEWKPGICQKAKIKCANCKHKDYPVLNEKVIDSHLRGYDNFVAGIYPMCLDETCYFLAISENILEEWFYKST